MTTLAELVDGLGIAAPPGADDIAVAGVAHDSRRVSPGDLFVTWSGARFDGAVHAPEAAAQGAAAVLADKPAPAGVEVAVPWLVAAQPRRLLGELAARAYDHPDRRLRLVGVTGTNGKSTVMQLVAAALERSGQPTGVMGTLGYRFRGQDLGFGRTTPEASDFFRMLWQMRQAGAENVVMEVSSHALAQGRIGDARFAVAVFTNLTRDHFDFHPDLEDYFAAKRRLFFEHSSEGGVAVVSLEDAYGARLAAELAGAGRRVIPFGIGGAVTFSRLSLDTTGTTGVIETPRGPLPFTARLLGRYNAANLLAAAAAVEALELSHAAFAAAVAAQEPLPGRLERVECGQGFPVFVDYAHTDAALSAAISSLKELAGARTIVVFGCGGDRDPGKRPLMGRAAGSLADFVVLTSDNPRSEDPMAILAAAEEGLRESGNTAYVVIPDRREAIRRAIAEAGPGSAVLVAGKGHEQTQIFRDSIVPFSDFHEIRQAIAHRLDTGGSADAPAA